MYIALSYLCPQRLSLKRKNKGFQELLYNDQPFRMVTGPVTISIDEKRVTIHEPFSILDKLEAIETRISHQLLPPTTQWSTLSHMELDCNVRDVKCTRVEKMILEPVYIWQVQRRAGLRLKVTELY